MEIRKLSFGKNGINKLMLISLLLGGISNSFVFADKHKILYESILNIQPKIPMRPKGVRPDPKPELINPLKRFGINSSNKAEESCSCKLVCDGSECNRVCTPAGCDSGGGKKACSCTWKCTSVDGSTECIKTCIPAGCEEDGSTGTSRSGSLNLSDAEIKNLLSRPKGARPDPKPELINPRRNFDTNINPNVLITIPKNEVRLPKN